MKMTRLPLEDASDDQIYNFCESSDLSPDTRDRAKLLALLGQVWPNPFILIAEAEPMPEGMDEALTQEGLTRTPAGQRLEGGLGEGDPIIVIRLGTTTYAGGNQPVPVGVNGRTVVLQRNTVIHLPYRFYDALRNAVRAEVTQDERTYEFTESEVRNYPLEVLEMPDKAEVAAFYERTKDVFVPA